MLQKLPKINLNRVIIIASLAALAFFIAFLFWWRWEIDIVGSNNEQKGKPSSVAGLNCENYNRRPIAVMMASDQEAKPLSGISQADLVFEMPVTPNGITRMMAIFQCEEPEEIGSIRSAREDFLTLVDSFGALYAHWGGEREALNKLNNGILDNIDAMKYEGTVFYRKNSIPRPHNGFTTIELLTYKAEDLGYASIDSFQGYLKEDNKPEKNLNNIVTAISINYEKPYDVVWTYDGGKNVYKRVRGGEAEIDRNTGSQIESSVVILMRAKAKFLSLGYISVNTTGEGEAEFYHNGIKASGSWKNSNNDLKFYDANSQEMKFIPGKMWVEIVTD